jgi:hypothetical protein
MSILEEISKAHIEHDPHGFKAAAAPNLRKLSGHVNQPYEHQEFPRVLYREQGSKTVGSESELEAALADGWLKNPPEAEPAKAAKPQPAGE